MPNDHRGITLVELIIAIAISTVILGAATLFLGMAHKNYNHASAQIDLQSESQILMEQIGMWVMEGNRVEELDPSVRCPWDRHLYDSEHPVGNQSGRCRSPGGCKQAGDLDLCRWKEIIYKENGCGRSKNRYNGDFCSYG